ESPVVLTKSVTRIESFSVRVGARCRYKYVAIPAMTTRAATTASGNHRFRCWGAGTTAPLVAATTPEAVLTAATCAEPEPEAEGAAGTGAAGVAPDPAGAENPAGAGCPPLSRAGKAAALGAELAAGRSIRLAACVLAESNSRFNRFKSARISAAVWLRSSRSFSRALLIIR